MLYEFSIEDSNLLAGVIVVEEFCKEMAAVAFVKLHFSLTGSWSRMSVSNTETWRNLGPSTWTSKQAFVRHYTRAPGWPSNHILNIKQKNRQCSLWSQPTSLGYIIIILGIIWGIYFSSSVTLTEGLWIPKFDCTGPQTHDLWIVTEHFMPLRCFRSHSQG